MLFLWYSLEEDSSEAVNNLESPTFANSDLKVKVLYTDHLQNKAWLLSNHHKTKWLLVL